MVWIVEWTQSGQSAVKVTVFTHEGDAFAATGASIMHRVSNDWDLGDVDCKTRAYAVSDACAASNWKEAVRLFNDWEVDGDYETMHQYRVYERKPCEVFPVVHLLRELPTTATPVPPTTPTVWKATHPGATCRGPCKQVSTDAYADQSNGTYCCYQCKFMSQAFGRPIP